MPIRFATDPGPEDLVNRDPLALLIAMLLDQQVPIEWAFAGPARLVERLGRDLDAATIAALDPDDFATVATGPPAIHRFPRSMATRIQALCAAIAADHGNDAAALWAGVDSGPEIVGRLEALPGFGPEKARITLAVLIKRFGLECAGGESAASPFTDDQPRSVADIDGPDSLAAVKAWKQRQREAGRSKADPTAPSADRGPGQAASLT